MWKNTDNSRMGGDHAGFIRSLIGPSQSNDGEKGKKTKAQNLVPMTIHQIQTNAAPNDIFCVGEIQVHMVTIIGLVRSIERQTTHIVYEIDDMTGPYMTVQQWFQDEGDKLYDSKMPMVLKTYVRVIGIVRSMLKESQIVAIHIRPIQDLNELTLHFIQVMQTKLPLPPPDNREGGLNESIKMEVDGSNSSGFTTIQLQVFKVIGEFDSVNGCSIETVVRKLSNVSPIAIRDAITFLNNEGHVYSTIDDSHFKVTDGAS